MTVWTAGEVAAALGVTPPPEHDRTFVDVSTDTRSLQPDALFVALRGDRFDGHDYLAVAADAGATGVVVEAGTACPDGVTVFPVDDTRAALGRLARARREAIAGPVVAVTGTNGKTSTKEMLAAVLGVRWRVHATRANRNNLVGVPLTILEAPDDTEALVVEAGASLPGEVAQLRDIIAPTLGVVTNVSVGHVEGFGSIVGVMQEKVSLLEGVPRAVVGSDPPELAQTAAGVVARVTVAGTATTADVFPTAVLMGADGRATIEYRGHRCTLPVIGTHQVENAMIALAVGDALGVDAEAAVAALGHVALPGGRGRVVRSGALTLIDDTYNANPASVAAAIRTAAAMAGERRWVAVLGSMLELGPDSRAIHGELADRVLEAGPDVVAAVGEFAAAFEARRDELGDRLIVAPDPDSLGSALGGRLRGDELILLKASRGVGLERVIPHLIGDETN
jgi:UDP-N-acetylmuramoyl-tripeptide--D-alanyl-D-alanine ligase